jgi:hypothetical protein
MIDWDQAVGTPCTNTFGQSGQYTCLNGPTFPLIGNWTEGYEAQSPLGEGVVIDNTDPTLGVQYSAFPPGYVPVQGDQWVAQNAVTGVTETWAVKDVQPDGQGTAYLKLNQVS